MGWEKRWECESGKYIFLRWTGHPRAAAVERINPGRGVCSGTLFLAVGADFAIRCANEWRDGVIY